MPGTVSLSLGARAIVASKRGIRSTVRLDLRIRHGRGERGNIVARYVIEGRVIPERVDFNVPGVDVTCPIGGGSLQIRISIIKSKIFAHIESEQGVSYPDIRNLLLTIVGNLINFGGFHLVCGISYELESITNVDDRLTFVFGAEGHVFDNRNEFGERLTFAQGQFGESLSISVKALMKRSRVTRHL